MVYHVYEATFATKLGSKRRYVGVTTDFSKRLGTLQSSKRPVWLKAGCEKLSVWVLVPNVPTRGAALAVEALMTARRWNTTSSATRGGPWVRPTLSAKDEKDLGAIARCRSVSDVLQYAATAGSGKLSKHLKGISFGPAVPERSSSCQAAVPRTTPLCPRRCLPCPRPSTASMARVVKKRKSSGQSSSCGHVRRELSGLKYGAARYTKAKWGKEGLQAKRRHQRTWRSNR